MCFVFELFLGTLLEGNSGVRAFVGPDATRGRLLQKEKKTAKCLQNFVKNFVILKIFFFKQTAARGVQAATGSNTRVALQQCPKEKLENETQENTCYKPWLPEGVHLNTRLTKERVTKKV